MNFNGITDLRNRKVSDYSAISSLFNEKMIVNIGIISKVHNDNYIDVKMYQRDLRDTDVIIPDVRLLQLGTDKYKIFVQPAVGDNVLLLCPQSFVAKLEYNAKTQKDCQGCVPYDNMNMCAVLVRPESDDDLKTTIHIDEKGNVDIATEGNASVNVKGDAALTADNVSITGDTKTEIHGGEVQLAGTVTPSGTGSLCGIPYCVYSGAPQCGEKTVKA